MMHVASFGQTQLLDSGSDALEIECGEAWGEEKIQSISAAMTFSYNTRRNAARLGTQPRRAHGRRDRRPF